MCNSLALPLVDSEPEIGYQFGSDHAVTHMEIDAAKCEHLAIDDEELYFNFAAGNWYLFEEHLTIFLKEIEHIKPKSGDSTRTIDTYYHALVDSIHKAAKLAIPMCPPSKLPSFRLTKIIGDAIRARSTAERQWKRFRSPALKIVFNEATRHVAEVIGAEKNLRLIADTKDIEKLFRDNQSRRAWTKTRYLMRGRNTKRRAIPSLRLDNIRAESNQEKATAFAENWKPTFSGSPKTSTIPNDLKFWRDVDTAIDSDLDMHSLPYIPEIFTHNITRRALNLHIKKLCNKAPGKDEIFNIFLKRGGENLHNCLHYLYNVCLNSGYMPADWKVASVVPVPKSGKKPGLLEGYRPISLLSTISKLMESILTSFLSKFCEKNNFFPSHQAGFRKYRSTIDAVLRLVHDAAEGRSK
jgi:hypothetical protein